VKRRLLPILLAVLFLIPYAAFARGGGHSGHSSVGHSSKGYSSYHSSVHSRSSSIHVRSYKRKDGTVVSKHTRRYAAGVKRNGHGKIARSSKAKDSFMKQTGYPHGRPGYVVDHVVPLKRGGSDAPSNMQWQTKEAAEAKDKWE